MTIIKKNSSLEAECSLLSEMELLQIYGGIGAAAETGSGCAGAGSGCDDTGSGCADAGSGCTNAGSGCAGTGSGC